MRTHVAYVVLLASMVLIPSTTRAETFREVNGVVSMEAEHFTKNVGYTLRTDNGKDDKAKGWSGNGWMYSEDKTADRLDYEIYFSPTGTGTYYVQLRALAGYDVNWQTDWAGDDNGYHAEFDKNPISGIGIFVLKKRKWLWYGAYQHSNGVAVSFEVDTPGWHTFSIKRREQLSRLDKILLRRDVWGISGTGANKTSDVKDEGPKETLYVDAPDAGGDADPDAGTDVVADTGGADDLGSGAWLRVEAEQMSLEGYRVENGASASNGKMISLRDGAAGEQGTASYTFTGDAGRYELVLAYFDENDGTAKLAVYVDDVLLAEFVLDQDLGEASANAHTLVRKTIASAYALAPGSTIRVTGVEDPNEPARVDYIELLAVGKPADAGSDVIRDAEQRSDDSHVTHEDAASNRKVKPRATSGGCSVTSREERELFVALLVLCLPWLRRYRNNIRAS